jgi:hypothetical protein
LSPSSPRIELARGAITAADELSIQLIEPAGSPSVIMIVWPDQATVVRPTQYTATAAEIMKILAYASTRYAQTRAQRRC